MKAVVNVNEQREYDSFPQVVGNCLIGSLDSATRKMLAEHGWYPLTGEEPVASEGCRILRYKYIVNEDGMTAGKHILAEVSIAEEQAAVDAAAAAAAQADPIGNSERYVLENVYLMLCDSIRGDTSHAKIGVAQLEASMSALRKVDEALQRYDLRWWDSVQYRDIPAIVAAATELWSKL